MDYKENMGSDKIITGVPGAIKDGSIDAVQTMTKYTLIAATAIGCAYIIFDEKQRKQIKRRFLYGG